MLDKLTQNNDNSSINHYQTLRKVEPKMIYVAVMCSYSQLLANS